MPAVSARGDIDPVAGLSANRRSDVRSGVIRGATIAVSVARIICFKVDHVGDLLIAAPALLLLRRSFPDAELTLVCAPWNVGLAQRLGVADIIVPMAFFSQHSTADLDAVTSGRQRQQAIRDLLARELPPYDLAIDLRRDEDTRHLLTLVTANCRAGFGDQAVFSYLDVALPFTRHGPAEGCTSLRLTAHSLGQGSSHRVEDDRLYLDARSARLVIKFGTDSLWAPAEDGEPDTRPLGIALWRLFVQQLTSTGEQAGDRAEVSRAELIAGAGWLEWEPWGRWTTAANADLTVEVEMLSDEVELLAKVQGHTSLSHDSANVTVQVGSERAFHRFRNGDEPAELRLRVRPPIHPPTLRTDPFLMRGGRYRGVLQIAFDRGGEWSALTLIVRTARTRRALARVLLPEEAPAEGLLDFPFECELIDSGEPIVFEISAPSAERVTGVGIVELSMERQQGGYPTMPNAHMEQQLLDLSAMIALRYAQRIESCSATELAALLRRRRAGSSARGAVALLDARRRRRRWWRRQPGVRVSVGIAIGANKETKRWPLAFFADLCRRLLERPDLDLVLLGGPAEIDDARQVATLIGQGDRVTNLVGASKFEDFGEIVARLDAFVGLDTGSTHFAGRVGIPTLAIFGASHDPREWGPVGPRSSWTASDVACGDCSLSLSRQCYHGLKCMAHLTVDDVWPAVAAMIARAQSKPSIALGQDKS